MASSRKNIDLCPELYDYHACFTRPRIVEYYSIGKNFELAENLSSLNYVTAKSGLLNLDIKVKEKKLEEKSFRENKEMMRLDLFFKFITNHHEIIQRYTGTKIEDAGFVFGKKTLTKIGNALYDKNDTFMLCAHLLRGVIYVQVHYDTILFDSNIKFDPRMFYEYCYLSKIADSKPNTHNPVKKFVILSETKLKQHNVLHQHELYGLDANDEKFQEEIPLNLERKLVIDELNKRSSVDLAVSTFWKSCLTINKSRRLWMNCFWRGTNKILCGFINENAIVSEIKSYNTNDLEYMGKGKWKEQEILNFTAEVLTFIKDCFKEKLKCDDIKTANERLYFQSTGYGIIEMTEQEGFENLCWVPDWYINNESIP